jgi:hypothetical protein
MGLLPTISLTLSLLTFFGISLRRDLESRRKENYSGFVFIAPYVLGFLVIAIFVPYSLYQPKPIQHHSINTVSTPDGPSVAVDGNTRIHVFSKAEHFKITIDGELLGTDLVTIQSRFGEGKDVMVYALVVEKRRLDNKPPLVWVQRLGGGALNKFGYYTVEANLGGTGISTAKQNEAFAVSVFIPDKGVKLRENDAYEETELPKSVFRSDPIIVITHRNLDDAAATKRTAIPTAQPLTP